MRSERDITTELFAKYAEITVNLTRLSVNLAERVDYTLPLEKFILDDALKIDKTIGYYFKEYDKAKNISDRKTHWGSEWARDVTSALKLMVSMYNELIEKHDIKLTKEEFSKQSDYTVIINRAKDAEKIYKELEG